MQTIRRTLLLTLGLIFLTLPLLSYAQGSGALQLIPITPCRIVDTRNGMPIQGGTYQSFPVQGSQGACTGIPDTALAYSFNVTVVPHEPLGFLTIWPDGESQPTVSNLNSVDGRVKAVAAIVGAGNTDQGAVNVYASDTTDVILDLYGYYVAPSGSTLAFYPLTPCRVLDTRQSGNYLMANQVYTYPVSGLCNVPSGAAAYSLNFTAIPHEPLGYLAAWPAGQTQPGTSILNAPTGVVTANAALMQAGTAGEIDALASNDTDLVIDINGFFAPSTQGPGGLDLFTVAPCRVLDTRLTTGAFSGEIPVEMVVSTCADGSPNTLPPTAGAVVANATVLPSAPLGYLALWPNGQSQPVESTLNAIDGTITNNLAVVPTSNGYIDAYASSSTNLLIDLFSYFAIPTGLNGNYNFTISGYNTPGNPPPSPCQTGSSVGPFLMAGGFVATPDTPYDGTGTVSGVLDLNCANLNPSGSQPLDVSFTGSYSIQANGLGTITITPFGPAKTSLNLSVAVSSTGNGRLVLQNQANTMNQQYYLPQAWGAGAINLQNPNDFSLAAIGGNYAGEFSGVDSSLNRYAGAGIYIVTTSGAVSGTLDINDNGTFTPGLGISGGLTAPSTTFGRGTANFLTNGTMNHWIYYVTNANQSIFVETDRMSLGYPLLLEGVMQQSGGPFGNTFLNGTSVLRASGLSDSGGGATDVVLGLFTGDGMGDGKTSLDENNGGTLSQQEVQSGTYSVASSGKVTLGGGFGTNAPFLYLLGLNQAFILSQDASVSTGFLAPQSGSPFGNVSAIGGYWGGNHEPVTVDVQDFVTGSFADGNGNLTGTSNYSGMGGTGTFNFTYTYTVDGTGRMLVYQSGVLNSIVYVISPTRLAMLPFTTSNTDPSVAVFGSTN